MVKDINPGGSSSPNNLTNINGILYFAADDGQHGTELWLLKTFTDTDNDGIPDDIEDPNMDGIVDPGETDPYNPDTDGDGLSDGVEDANHNGVVDGSETDPRAADTDNDGMPDGWETDNLLDPLVDDSLGDEDHDGASNLDEYLNNTDPNDPSSFPVKSNPGIILLLLGD